MTKAPSRATIHPHLFPATSLRTSRQVVLSQSRPSCSRGSLARHQDLLPMSTHVGCPFMGRTVDVDDLIDAQGVADLLGLAQRNTVSLYQKRYPDMPRPVVDLGQGRCKMWSAREVAEWQNSRSDRP